jgi:hypothetical protein
MFRFLVPIALIVLSFGSHSAKAGIVVSIDNLTLTPGFSQATMDVWIRAEADSQNLSSYDFEFRIEALNSQAQLRFINPHDDSLHFSDPDYVFAGGSLKRDASPPQPLGTVSRSPGGPPGDTYAGGDISLPLFDSITLDNTPRLLARLQLQPGENDEFAIGDQFAVSLIDSNTGFWVVEFPLVQSPISYESNIGIVTFGSDQPVTVIPEPSGLTIFAGLAAFGLAAGWWRRRPAVARGSA